MKKYDLLKRDNSIIRILEIQGDRVLVIDCIKRTMPRWMEKVELEPYSKCSSDELSEVTGIVMVDIGSLGSEQRKVMYERYTMIAPILSFITPYPLPKPPIQRRRTAQAGARRKGNGICGGGVHVVPAWTPHNRQKISGKILSSML